MLNLIKDELCQNSMSVNFILFHLQQPTPFTRVTYVNTEGQTTQPTPFTRVTYVNTERQASVLQINSLQYFNFLMRKVKWSWGTCLWVKFYPWTFIFFVFVKWYVLSQLLRLVPICWCCDLYFYKFCFQHLNCAIRTQ